MNDARPLITAIANPTSGAGAALHRWESIAARLEAAGRRTRVVRTEGRGHAGEAAEAAARAGDLVVAVGGDGHVLEITTGVVRGGGTMALVPAGRGNDLARALGLPASDQDLADLLLTGEVRHLDVLEVAGQFIPGNVYFGLDGDASRIVNEYRWVPARLLYRINGPLALLRWRPLRVTLTVDGHAFDEPAHMVVVANSGRYGHGMPVVPNARLDDGILRVLTVRAESKHHLVNIVHLMRALPHLLAGTHLGRGDVVLRPGSVVELRADRPTQLWADGEVIGELPAEVRICPGALAFVAPLPAAM